jgi:hypothetical protein
MQRQSQHSLSRWRYSSALIERAEPMEQRFGSIKRGRIRRFKPLEAVQVAHASGV